MVPEAAIAMLACARLGRGPLRGVRRLQRAVVADRIQDSQARMVITRRWWLFVEAPSFR